MLLHQYHMLNLQLVSEFFLMNFYQHFRILQARLSSKFEYFFQRNLAQYWTKRLQIVIVLISITVLVYYKLDCALLTGTKMY